MLIQISGALLEMLIIANNSNESPSSRFPRYTRNCLLLIFIAKMAMFLSLLLFALTETFANEVHANVWAVKMSGDLREVEKFALKYNLPYDIHMKTSFTFPLTSETEVSFSEIFLECF